MGNTLKIEELKDLRISILESNKYMGEPLMEYVWKVANHFSPSFDGESFGESDLVAIFCNRYIESKLTDEEIYQRKKEMSPAFKFSFDEHKRKYKKLNSTFLDKYINNKELQDTIQAFGLDVSKFWYLLLFVHDYTEDLTTNAPTVCQPVLVDCNNFVTQLSEATSITLRKNNRKSYVTEREDTIKIVRNALDYYIKAYNNIINEESADKNIVEQLKDLELERPISGDAFRIDFQSKRNLDISYKKWKFAEMFQYFLEDKKASRSNVRDKRAKVYTDKLMLISRLIYIVNYGIEAYNDPIDKEGNPNRMLSNLLRRYRNEKFPSVIANDYTIQS